MVSRRVGLNYLCRRLSWMKEDSTSSPVSLRKTDCRIIIGLAGPAVCSSVAPLYLTTEATYATQGRRNCISCEAPQCGRCDNPLPSLLAVVRQQILPVLDAKLPRLSIILMLSSELVHCYQLSSSIPYLQTLSAHVAIILRW